MKVYSPSEIAKLLEVKESTLRKYSLLLEGVGYEFQRNNQKQRWYSDNDVIALRKLVTLKNNGDMALKECAEAVFLWVKGDDVTLPSTDTRNDTKRYDNDITELKNMISRQNELIGELSKRLDTQQNYISERLNKHDKLVMQSLNESLEARKQIAAAEENKQGFFSKLFKKENLN